MDYLPNHSPDPSRSKPAEAKQIDVKFNDLKALQRREKANAIAIAIGKYTAAYVARYVHMTGRNEGPHEALVELAETIAAALK